MPSTSKQVKVDNWAVFFLQRLKHFFNKTDYCDLTLQFHGYAQLKVHRVVLNACTEYFDILEKACEVYDDCLLMPDDLQVDVMVPIINFMYTGVLEYETHLFDRLYDTTRIMNMTVLTKLLDAQRAEITREASPPPKKIILMNSHIAAGKLKEFISSPSTSAQVSTPRETIRKKLSGRQYGPAQNTHHKNYEPKIVPTIPTVTVSKPLPKKPKLEKPGPTRYEVPEELEDDNIFESSFADISYASQPLMRSYRREKVEPDIKIKNIYDEDACSRKFEEMQASSSSYKRERSESMDESKQSVMEQIEDYNEYSVQSMEEDIFDTNNETMTSSQDSSGIYSSTSVKQEGKVSNLDHAKIISEVLKKYPHLVNSNKNIKLKIMPSHDKSSHKQPQQSIVIETKKLQALSQRAKIEPIEDESWMYTRNVDQDSVARLISMGIANVNGPWLCLICGTPGKALNFPTYNKFYRHLADVHLEKIPANICEHCGYKSGKRNHLLHHMYTKHGIPPPPQYVFPKCNVCDYVALTKAFLIKHKLTHTDNRQFTCNVCTSSFKTRSSLLNHIQVTGHKISPDRKTSNQCVYCNKIFLRESNLYTHLTLCHKELAKKDAIIDNSDDECIKFDENSFEYSTTSDGKIQIITNISNPQPKKSTQIQSKAKILNAKLLNNDLLSKVKYVPGTKSATIQSPTIEFSSESESLSHVASGIATSLSLSDRTVMFNDNEYVIQTEGEGDLSIDHPLPGSPEVIVPDMVEHYYEHSIQVSMPQPTTTTQIMNQKQSKPTYKNIVTQHRIIAPNVQQQQQLVQQQQQQLVQQQQQQLVQQQQQQLVQQQQQVSSATPVVFTSNPAMMAGVAPKYVQADNMNISVPSNETIMVLQDGELNIDQAVTTNGSNIVVVYSHPLQGGDKQFVHFKHEQLPEQPSEIQEAEIQNNQVDADQEMVMANEEIMEEGKEGEWVEQHVEESQEDEREEGEIMVEQQEIPVTESEAVEIIMEQNPSENVLQENIQEAEQQTDGVVLGNDDKVYNEEVVEYGESIEEQEQQAIVEAEHVENNDVEEMEQVVESVVEAQPLVEWSDEEAAKAEGGVVGEGAQPSEEVEMIEESIENIEREVQKHITDKTETSTDQIEEEENLVEEQIQSEEAFVSTEGIVAEPEGIVEEECQPTQEIDTENGVIHEAAEQVMTDEIEGEQTLEEQKMDVVEGDTITEVMPSPNTQQKNVEKISNLLNDWDDSQPETTSEGVEENKSSSDPKESEEQIQVASQVPVAKAANIEKLVSDWDEDDEK